jgi:hypothetical protein
VLSRGPKEGTARDPAPENIRPGCRDPDHPEPGQERNAQDEDNPPGGEGSQGERERGRSAEVQFVVPQYDVRRNALRQYVVRR